MAGLGFSFQRPSGELPAVFWTSTAFPITNDSVGVVCWLRDTLDAFVKLCISEMGSRDYRECQDIRRRLGNYFALALFGGKKENVRLTTRGTLDNFWLSGAFQELLHGDGLFTSPLRGNQAIEEIAGRLRSQSIIAFRYSAVKGIVLGVGPSSVRVGDLFFIAVSTTVPWVDTNILRLQKSQGGGVWIYYTGNRSRFSSARKVRFRV
jgi:hypothetical protein